MQKMKLVYFFFLCGQFRLVEPPLYSNPIKLRSSPGAGPELGMTSEHIALATDLKVADW